MPIFEYNGKKYNVKDEHIDSFMNDFPDASTIMEREGKKYRVRSSDYNAFMSELPATRASEAQTPVAMSAQMPAEQQRQGEQEYVEGFGEGFKQGWQGLVSGSKYFAGEIANAFSGSSMDDKNALGRWDELQKKGVDIAEATKTKNLGDDAIVSENGTLRALSQQEKLDYETIQKAIQEAGGDMDKARKLMEQRAKETTWGDSLKQEAAEEMNQMKPTKGLGAWVGNLAPQMLPSAAALALSYFTKNPKWAKMVGNIGMAGMTASTAGSTMKEARDAGASDMQVWGAGVADGTIEYLTEKLPFDKMTNRIFGNTKKKLSREIAEGLADNPQTREEMERLLGEAANSAGLNWKQVGKSVLAQTTAEGLSEAAAGTLQTATQMIYQEPENYPTLYDYVTNAWEGAKAGMFMGAVLGAPVPLAQKVQNDKRRKQQGEVYVAGYINDNGETEVVEVVGSSKDGNLVVFGQSGYKEISPEDVTYAHTFSYQEFKTGELEQEFDNGYNLETPQEMTDAKNMYDMQRQRVAEALGEEVLADIDRDPEAAIGKLGEDEPTNRTVIEYLNAKMVYDGMNKRVADDADARIAESDALVDAHTHKKTGMVQGAVMKENDRKVYVVNGNVVPLQDGTGIDLEASDNSIIIRDAESGELEQVSPEVLLNVDAGIDPTAEKQAAREAIEAEVRANAERMQNGVVGFAPGDVYTVLGEDGNIHQVEIVQDNGDNTVAANVDGEPVDAMAKEQIQNEVDAYNKQRVVVVAESAEDAENAEEAKPNYELNAHVTLQTPEGVVTGNINQAENDDNLIEVQVNKPFGGKKTVDMYTREELDNMVVEVADENGNVIWSKPAESTEAAANVQGAENTNTSPEDGAENVNTVPSAPIVRGKQGQIDAAESIKAGTTPQQMADAYVQEYGDEEGLPLSTAQEKLAQVQEERQKTKDVDLKNGPLRKQEKFWAEVVDLLTPKEEAVAEEGRQETVSTPVALQYLLEGGKGSIENAGYFFYAIQAAFPHIGAQLQEIRNSMPAEMLGMAPDAFVASNPSQLQEVRGLVEATYGEAGTRILDQMLANSTGFYPREGKALDLEIENLKPVEGNEQVQEVTEKDSLLKKVKDWLSPENISWAEGKSLSESIEMFGNEVEPIAIIPPVLKKYFPELSNLYLYSGKAYLIDHAANHHPELSVEEYENIQKTLDEYDDIKDLSSNGVKKLAFIKMMEKGYAVVTELSEKDGKIMLHKTFFYKDVNGKRVPYKNKPSLFDKTSVDGSTTISPAEKTTAGRHRNISALDVSADKGTDKSVTQEGTQEEISEKAQNATQSEQNELEKAEKKRIDALAPTIEDVADDMQTADEFVAGLFGNGIRITPESFRKETGLGWEEQRRLVGIIAGKEKGGLTVEQAAETIVENYRAELAERGFSGDSMEMRDMVIDILNSGNPRAYAKQAAARRAEQALHREMEAFDRYTQEAFHMSAEEYIMYEESMLPKYIEQYKDFDEQEYYSNFADEQSTQNEHDTTRESAETGRGSEILSEEQPSATPGEGTAGEGQQGGTLQGDVQGNAQEGIARAEAGQEVAEQPAENKNRTRFSSSVFEDAERIAREEQRRAPLRRTARAWEKILGVKVHLIERLEDVKNPDAIREIQASEKRGKKNVPGWFEGSTGEVFVYLPHVENEKEVDKTCVHEIVSHKGLKELLGQEKFDELCRKVWGIMSPAARNKYRNYPGVKNELEAADEYIAHLSEEVELTARERSVWQKIMDFIADLLGRKADNRSKAASIVGKETLSRKDIAELVRLSYAEYLQRNGREEAVKEAVELREVGESQTMLRIVDDPNVIAELEASPKRRGFRNVVRNEDGTFSSPMAYWLQSTTGGAKTRVETAKFELGKWEKAEEHPELVDENGKIVLVKPDKGTIPVAYDPYIHNRLDPVNLQFKDAWKRNDLIYVETEVPTTDLESGYHADKALLPVGLHSWSNGDLMLSIYDKPTRFVPWDEVADAWAERLAGKEVHFDVVPPTLRSLLVDRGVDIVAPHKGMGKDCRDAYAEWKESVDGNNIVRFRFTEEEQGIIDEAKKNGTYMKAPNGQPTNLNEKQWAQVRTKAFKKWFGDWEKVLRIAKLRKSNPVEIVFNGEYELNRDSAKRWMKDNLRGEYINADTREKIAVSKVGINEVTSHGSKDEAHLKSLPAIPSLIEKSIFIEELSNSKEHDKYDSYRYYVCGANIDGQDYTIKIVIGVKDGAKYYDHRLTQIEKGNLLDNLNGLSNSVAEKQNASFIGKDTKLHSILQTNSSKIVDENGEPMVVYHGSEEDFNVFDKTKGRANMDIQGMFFSPWDDDARGYGSNVRAFYLNIRKPANESTGYKALKKFQGQNGACIKAREYLVSVGYDGVNNEDQEFVAFEANQIKSATENNGEFSAENNDIRFRTLPNERLRKLDEGETCNVERVFTQQKMFNFSSGEKIESYEDVAYIFRSLEDEAVENAFVALVKNGKPTIVHLGMGTATQTTVDQQAVIVAIERINPDAVYFVHNHPSGNLKASRQDALLLDSMKKAYGDIVKDGIIINLRSGKYAVFNEEGIKVEEASPNTPEKEIPAKTYSFSKRVFDKDFDVEELMHVTGSDAVDAYAREHGLVAALTSSQRLGERGKLSLLVISQGNKIVGNVFLNHTEVLPSNLGNISKEIAYYVSAMGGQAGILYGRFGINETRHLGGAVNRISAGSVRLLDAISMTEFGGYVSALDEGVMEETPSYGKGETRFRVTDDIEDANARFNEELEKLNEENADSIILSLGRPSDILISAGVEDKPMKLYGNKVIKKMKKHGFAISELFDLPSAVADPIAVFDNLGREGNRSVLTELKTANGNFLVSLDLGKGEEIDFNIVSSVFGKGEDNIVDWFERGLSTYINKEKALNYLHHSALHAVALRSSRLDSAAKVIKDFQNPSVGGGIRFRSVDKLRDRYDKMVRLPNKIGSVKWYENLPYRLREAYQDSMLSLKVLQDVILEETGNTMTSGENAYMAENQMSSKNKAEAEMYERDFFKPMMEEVKSLLAAGATYDEVQKYLFAKHGLERNMEMYKKNKQEAIDKWIEERTEQLVNGGMTEADARVQAQQDIALYPSMSDAELDKKYRRDYSGLTALTEKDNVADAEAEASQMVSDFEGRFSTADLWGKINAATRETLRKSYDSGMMDKATYEKILGMYHYYIPLRGWDADVAEKEYEYLSDRSLNLSPVLVKTEGRTSLADDPIATIGFMAEGAIVQGNRNLMKQRFMNFVLNNPTSLVSVSKQWYVEQADGTWMPDNPQIPADATGDQVAAIVEQHEQDMLSPGKKAKTKRAGLKLDLHATKQEGQEHMVRVKRGGKEYCLYINGSPRAAQALNGMTNPDASNSDLYKAASAVKNFMARMFTSQNPAFVVSNLSRDLIWAGTAVAVRENKNYAARYTKNVGKAFKNATLPRLLRKYQNGTLDMNVEEERLFMEFIKHGGETGFTQITSVEDYKKDIKRFVKEVQKGKFIGKKVWDGFFDTVEFLNRSAEDTTRFMVYMTSRQMGRDVATSVSDAKEITVNFNKKGSGGLGASVMNFCYIFFNAAIQSLSGFGKMMAEHPKRTLAGLTAYASAGVIVPAMSIALQALTGDDDDESYWDLPEWIRRNNLVLYVPFTDSGFITIPLPHELRPFYAMGEIALSAMCGREDVEDGLRKVALNFAEMLPLDFTGNGGNLAVNLTPTVAQPAAQIIANKDYTGKPIYKDHEWNKRDPEWTKAYKGTSPWIVEGTKWLNRFTGGDDVKSGAVDLNPALIEHVLESYTGGAGKTFNRTMKTFQMMWDEDMRQWRNVPVISSFVQSGDERIQGSDVNNRYYEAKDEFEDTKHLLSGYKEKKKEHKPGTADYVEYARKLDELMNSDEYKRYKVFKGRQKAIKKVSDKLKDTNDRDRIDTLNTRLMQLKEEMLEELEKADDSPKP